MVELACAYLGQMASTLGVDAHQMHVALEAAVREHLIELGELRPRVIDGRWTTNRRSNGRGAMGSRPTAAHRIGMVGSPPDALQQGVCRAGALAHQPHAVPQRRSWIACRRCHRSSVWCS